MTQDELNAALAASPSPDRVTPEYLASRIAKVDYARLFGTLTLCVITLDNGFTVTGESACADPANYREDVGRKISYDMAERKIWPLLGFALKEAMAARDATKAAPADYRDRVRAERAELVGRLDKLRTFLSFENHQKRGSPDDSLLRDQESAMSLYLRALDARIAAFPA